MKPQRLWERLSVGLPSVSLCVPCQVVIFQINLSSSSAVYLLIQRALQWFSVALSFKERSKSKQQRSRYRDEYDSLCKNTSYNAIQYLLLNPPCSGSAHVFQTCRPQYVTQAAKNRDYSDILSDFGHFLWLHSLRRHYTTGFTHSTSVKTSDHDV